MGADRGRKLVLALATWGGVGYLPVMPGTWGTLAALPLWYSRPDRPLGLRPGGGGPDLLALWVAGPAQAILGRADHAAIVIDEVVGLFITLAGVSLTWQHAVRA